MSAAFEEIIRRAYDAFNRGDFDEAVKHVHPDVEISGTLESLKGRDALRKWLEPDMFESQRFEVKEVTVRGDVVLAHITTTGRGAGSGIEFTQEAFNVFWFSDGEIVRISANFDREDAERDFGDG